jgi:hypothetical protein
VIIVAQILIVIFATLNAENIPKNAVEQIAISFTLATNAIAWFAITVAWI